jgi:hypothetical protein
MIGVTLVTLASVMAASINQTIDELIGSDIEADVIIRSTSEFDPTASFTPELADRAVQDESVDEVSRQQTGVALFNETETFVIGIEPNYPDFFPVDSSEGNLYPGSCDRKDDFRCQRASHWFRTAVVVRINRAYDVYSRRHCVRRYVD